MVDEVAREGSSQIADERGEEEQGDDSIADAIVRPDLGIDRMVSKYGKRYVVS